MPPLRQKILHVPRMTLVVVPVGRPTFDVLGWYKVPSNQMSCCGACRYIHRLTCQNGRQAPVGHSTRQNCSCADDVAERSISRHSLPARASPVTYITSSIRVRENSHATQGNPHSCSSSCLHKMGHHPRMVVHMLLMRRFAMHWNERQSKLGSTPVDRSRQHVTLPSNTKCRTRRVETHPKQLKPDSGCSYRL